MVILVLMLNIFKAFILELDNTSGEKLIFLYTHVNKGIFK